MPLGSAGVERQCARAGHYRHHAVEAEHAHQRLAVLGGELTGKTHVSGLEGHQIGIGLAVERDARLAHGAVDSKFGLRRR
jgi:hypothetical protein